MGLVAPGSTCASNPAMAALASLADPMVTKPYPLERPVSWSMITLQDAT